jgi:adhesin transport system membrane fusion protein
LRVGETHFQREAEEQLGRTEQAIAQLEELLAEATEQGVRAEIKSPIDGIVKKLRYYTIGGIVSPGEPIMEIVPTGDKLVVEAKLNPTDRGYVNEGQRSLVKVSTYDFARYGGLDGTVANVAPDSTTDQNGTPYFRVIVQTDKTYLGEEEGKLPITPGMQATVDIHTGTKSVMEYLIKPVLKLRHEAFRER